MLRIEDFFSKHSQLLHLHWVSGRAGKKKAIRRVEIERPALALSGFFKNFSADRMLVFGNTEMQFFSQLDLQERQKRLKNFITEKTPAIICSITKKIPGDLNDFCEKEKIPLFQSALETKELLVRLSACLVDELSQNITCHGTFLEVFGVGVFVEGESSIGKSEAALGLVEKGHRLISDDVVKFKSKSGFLEGSGPELNRHLIEIRGIGIINVAHLYGMVCVRDAKRLDLIVKLEEWNSQMFYDRVGLEEKYAPLLGVNVPFYVLPVKPGRDVVLLIETIVLNYRLKLMGHHTPKEFNKRLLAAIAKKQRRKTALNETISTSEN